ncbi:MAG: DinB family protein [Blastocatellia bacterium]|nr:DinB family protein [Blastocatellia bacterium]
MPEITITRPDTSEYAPYYERYISLVPEGDIIALLSRQLEETLDLLRGISDAKAQYRYAPDKWSIKEVIGHIIDSERIFAYRALRFARNDGAPLAGFEQDGYVRYGGFDGREMADLLEEFEHVRRANIHMLRSFDDRGWERRGTASEAEVSVKALAYIIAGHERHHVRVLKTRYL